MATTEFQKQVAKEVIQKCARAGMTRFIAEACERFARESLRGKVVYGAGGYNWRAIRPLVEKNFEEKVARAAEELRKESLQPPNEPKESLEGSPFPPYVTKGAREHASSIENTLPPRDRE